MTRHIAPNVVGPMIVIFSASIGTNILAEAGLSFLNLSVPGPSWGGMVADGRAFLDSKPMMSLAAGGAITIAVLGFNLLGDGLRDVLESTAARLGPLIRSSGSRRSVACPWGDLLVRGRSAIDRDKGARYPGRRIRCQKHRDGGDFLYRVGALDCGLHCVLRN